MQLNFIRHLPQLIIIATLMRGTAQKEGIKMFGSD